jgi:hypothetical protein
MIDLKKQDGAPFFMEILSLFFYYKLVYKPALVYSKSKEIILVSHENNGWSSFAIVSLFFLFFWFLKYLVCTKTYILLKYWDDLQFLLQTKANKR